VLRRIQRHATDTGMTLGDTVELLVCYGCDMDLEISVRRKAKFRKDKRANVS
jgi:hypothetical protein